MKKSLLILTIILLQLSSFDCNAGPSLEKVKKNIIGTWKFENLYNPYAPLNTPDVKDSNDPNDLYTAYTFMDNGKVIVWSLDRSKLDIPNQTFTWGIITKKDAKEEEYTVVKMVESDIDPNDMQKIENSNTGLLRVVTTLTKNNLLWIKINRTDKLWKTEWQKRFSKIQDLPKE